MFPGIGASLSDFIGEPNTRQTANLLHDRLRMAIVSLGLVNEEDLDIKIVPTHRTEVAIFIRVAALSTPYNSLRNGELLTVTFLYDYMDLNSGVFFLASPIS
jgi:hypothetical protein